VRGKHVEKVGGDVEGEAPEEEGLVGAQSVRTGGEGAEVVGEGGEEGCVQRFCGGVGTVRGGARGGRRRRRRRRKEARRGAAVQALGRDQAHGGEAHLAEHEAEDVAGYEAAPPSKAVRHVGKFEGPEGGGEEGAEGDPVGGADFCGLEVEGGDGGVGEEEDEWAEDH